MTAVERDERHQDPMLPSSSKSIPLHRCLMPSSSSSSFTPLLTTNGPGRFPGPSVWCPTMDLLAMATSDGRLSVRRLDWTRLWSARVGTTTNSTATAAAKQPPPTATSSSITALSWSPDGRSLAVASGSGALEVRAAEDGEVLASFFAAGDEKKDSSPLVFVALSWATDGSSENRGNDDDGRPVLSLRDSLVDSGPPLPPCPLPPPAPFEEEEEKERQEEEEEEEESSLPLLRAASARRFPPQRHEPQSLQVLAAADDNGFVHLLGPGMIPIARLPVAEAVTRTRKTTTTRKNEERGDDDERLTIRAVALSTGLDALHVLLASPRDPGSESLYLATVDTSALSRSRRELARVLHVSGHALSSLSSALGSASVAAREWREARRVVEREVLEKLDKLLEDFGEKAPSTKDEGGVGRLGEGSMLIGGSSRTAATKTPPSSSSDDASSFPAAVACLTKAALCGASSAPLSHFWESSPGSRGLRSAARAADAAARSASGVLRSSTEPALEAACYWVGELQRVAESGSGSIGGNGEATWGRWGGEGSPLGLQRAAAAEASKRARDAAAAAPAARRAVAAGCASSRELFLWLMTSAARVATTGAGAAALDEEQQEQGGEEGGGGTLNSAVRAAAVRAASRAAAAVLPRADPLAATRSLSSSVDVNPRLAASVALGFGKRGGGAVAKKKKGKENDDDVNEEEENNASSSPFAVATCDPLSSPSIPRAVHDALGRRSWPPRGRGTARSLALATAEAIEDMLRSLRERMTREIISLSSSSSSSEGAELVRVPTAWLGSAAKGGQVCLVSAASRSTCSPSAAAAAVAAFVSPGGRAAVSARCRCISMDSSSSSNKQQRRRREQQVEVAAVAPVVIAAGEGGVDDGDRDGASRVVGVGLYKGGALALLSDVAGRERATLALVRSDELSFSAVRGEEENGEDDDENFDDKNEGIIPCDARLRVVSSLETPAAAPLAVSAPRGVACALTSGGARATIFDLEDDDDEDGDVDDVDVEGNGRKSEEGDEDDENARNNRQGSDGDSSCYDTSSESESDDGGGGGGMSSE